MDNVRSATIRNIREYNSFDMNNTL